MRHHTKQTNDPKLRERMEKAAHRDHHTEHFFRRVLHYIERTIAVATLVVLVGFLILEFYQIITCAIDDIHSLNLHDILTNILTIVVGMEFVRMLIDTTPANILEVLTVAMTRHIILTHDDYISNLVCVICIAGLFAIRRYLVRRSELTEEMVDIE